MLPAALVLLDALPLTANGKVDRRALRAPEDLRTESDHVAPRTEVERTIVRVWQEALRVEKISVDDNFFDLGGHSLLIIKVNDKLREAFNRTVSIVDMFNYPTISSLANYLSQEQPEQPSPQPVYDLAKIRRESIEQQRQIRQERLQREG